jgi:hypothetical protein
MKVKINGVEVKTSSNGNWQLVTYDNGKTAGAWKDDFMPHIEKEVEVETWLSKDGKYNNIKLASEGNMPQSDSKPKLIVDNSQLKVDALRSAATVKSGMNSSYEEVITLANQFLTWVKS